jgi:hypothetical protein
MKFKIGLTVMIGSAALCMALPALGQNSVTLTGVNGSTSSDNGGSLLNGEDVYTGQYYSTVNGTANTPTICDDFNHDVTIGETWNATAINTSALNSTNILGTEFGSGVNGQIAPVVYAEVATLVSEIFTLNNTTGLFHGLTVSGTDLSEAIWQITTSGGISGITANAAALVSYVKGLFGSDTSTQALAYLNGLNLWILTPAPNNGPQEFWAPGGGPTKFQSVPEGGSAALYLLLAGLTCLGATILGKRNQDAISEPA